MELFCFSPINFDRLNLDFCSEFAKEREKVENRQEFLKLRQAQQVERELDGYVEWVCKAEEVILAEERTTDEEKRHIFASKSKYYIQILFCSIHCHSQRSDAGQNSISSEILVRRRNAARKRKLNAEEKSKSTDTEDDSTFDEEGSIRLDSTSTLKKYVSIWFIWKSRLLLDCKSKKKREGTFWIAEKRFRYWIRHTVKTQWFYWFVIMLVFLNTITVAAEHYNQPQFLTEFLCESRKNTPKSNFQYYSVLLDAKYSKIYLNKEFECCI